MRGLYLVTDRGLCGNRSLEDVAHQALVAGAACIQLREKDVSTRFFVEEARKIKALTVRFRVPLIINDRIDVALASVADGVHIGQDDMPYAEARRLMGPEAIIGLSVETWDDVLEAEALDVNYLGVSPIFETPTKTDTKGNWGLEGLARIKAYSRHLLVAIGGLNASNTEDAVMAGADCIAVVSAICAAPDPLRASREINEIIQAAFKKRGA
ncbi:MAG TPA: thiamine phosphate synthase [Syntrophales bacterium]